MLATKFASNNSAHTIHAPRARASQRRWILPLDVREDSARDRVSGGARIGLLLVPVTGESFHRKRVSTTRVQDLMILRQSIPYLRLVSVTASVTASVTNCWASLICAVISSSWHVLFGVFHQLASERCHGHCPLFSSLNWRGLPSVLCLDCDDLSEKS